jgi:opacity protein-like surface antigen
MMAPFSSFLLRITIFVLSCAALSRAQPLYPYYVPYRFYRPVDTLSPPAAALGPWKWNLDVGGGPTTVVGGARDRFSNGWNFNFGAGYNATPRAGFLFEFSQSALGITNAELQRNGAFDGDASVWSLTLNPIWRFRISGPVGAYLIGGGGFYSVEKRFTEPVQILVSTPGGDFLEDDVDVIHQTNNTGGLNVGAGLTCNLGWGTKFFVEARYHHLFTAGGVDLVPVTFGFRW